MLKKTKTLLFLLILPLTSCSTYKSTWDCPKAKGIGCSSIDYADEIAREQIILNKYSGESKKVLINSDMFADDQYEELELN